MVDFLVKMIRWGILFIRTSFGVMNSPYVTYRRLSGEKSEIGEVFYIYGISILYFVWVTILKTVPRNPFLLTVKLNVLLLGTGIGIGVFLCTVYGMAKLVRSKGSFKTLFLLYSYSLLPTIIWFFATSLLYLFFPPPRTISILGKALSIVYIAFSMALLLWKFILYYLTIRFAFRLDVKKIIRVSLVSFPTVMLYALILYKLGIFRIPFI